MQDLKTYLSVTPVLYSTLWLGALASILIKINRFFPDVSTFPPFFFHSNS
uniref:Photosystem I reaction center subunit IX n=1 Tax=Cistanche phelypaea TaxID=87754 RepID=A0A097ZR59_9LAMI|nr:photosystem I subunit IX [Cistanche phelypaea]CDH98437.1 photosystem I subunit IX [Cistanche phelypaea]